MFIIRVNGIFQRGFTLQAHKFSRGFFVTENNFTTLSINWCFELLKKMTNSSDEDDPMSTTDEEETTSSEDENCFIFCANCKRGTTEEIPELRNDGDIEMDVYLELTLLPVPIDEIKSFSRKWCLVRKHELEGEGVCVCLWCRG